MKTSYWIVAAAVMAISAFGALKMLETEAVAFDETGYTKTMSGLLYKDETVGQGQTAEKGDKVSVHYTGRFMNGKKFDSSKDRGQPFGFRLGARQVIAGWDEGVAGMKVGGKRILVIPPELGYGEYGVPGAIPSNATLKFDVELLDVQ